MTLPTSIAGRYTVQRALGRGAMGTVWLCFDESLRRPVALKQINPGLSVDGKEIDRARREARAIASINNQHVVRINDILEDEGVLWLVMEYVDALNLQQIVQQYGRQSPEAVAKIGAQVATALAAAHAIGIIHRDVKPANILVTTAGEAKLVDFGIALVEDDDQLTRQGVLSGTPVYFSPELARTGEASTAADVWALGATLYAAVEGRAPYDESGTSVAMLHRIVSEAPRPTEHAGALSGVLAGMLNPDPERRWTMSEAANRLASVVASPEDRTEMLAPVEASSTQIIPAVAPAAPVRSPAPPIAAPPPNEQDDRADEPQERRRTSPWVWVAAVIALLLIAGGVTFALSGDEPDPNPTPVSSSSSSTSATTSSTSQPSSSSETSSESPTSSQSLSPKPPPSPSPPSPPATTTTSPSASSSSPAPSPTTTSAPSTPPASPTT